jgi:hypothetical protein
MQYRTDMDSRVIMIVRCYLKAWNECISNIKDEFLLSRVSIIKYYKSNLNFDMQIMFAIEIFISQNKINDNWSSKLVDKYQFNNDNLYLVETISRLFQFFLDQNCIRKETIIKWNSDGHLYNETYYEETKRFAQPFIQQLMTEN